MGRLLQMPAPSTVVHSMYDTHHLHTTSGKLLDMIFPDEGTMAFWKATEDYPGEYAQRVARYSRQMQEKEEK